MNNNPTNILFFPEKFFKNKVEEIKYSKSEISKNEISNFNTIPSSYETFSFIKKANNNFPIKRYKSNFNQNTFNKFIFNN